MRACFCGRAARGFAWHDFKSASFDRLPPVASVIETIEQELYEGGIYALMQRQG